MRAKRKEITDAREIERILDQAQVLHLAMCRDGEPYVVPVCFARKGKRLLVHSARKGRKIETLLANPRVCFEVESDVAVVRVQGKACDFSMRFQSVIGFGRAEVVLDEDRVGAGLDALMAKYADGEWSYRPEALAKTAIIEIGVESVTGKRDRGKGAVEMGPT